jgi:hypothetical protein
MRPEIVEFKRICDNLLGSAQQNDWTLTEKERKVVEHYIQELGNRVLPSSQKMMISRSLCLRCFTAEY